jgi:hypothetical protein
MSAKPWLEVNLGDRYWFSGSNHESDRKFDTTRQIDAFVIVQDCNMGGEYHRIVFWSLGATYLHSKRWPFDKNFADWVEGDTITYIATQATFVVVKRTEFTAILESV